MAEERPAFDIMAGVRELLADSEPLPGDPTPPANPFTIPAGAWVSFDVGPGGITAITQWTDGRPVDPEAEKAARKKRRVDRYQAIKSQYAAGSMVELIAGFSGTQAQVDDMRDRRVVTDWEYRARIVPAVGMAYAEMLREARYLAGKMDDCVACGCDDCILRDLDQYGLKLDDTLAAIQSLSKWLIARQ